MLGERMAHLTRSAVAIIGGAFDKYRDPARAITFITDFFVMRALELTGAALNGAFDIILGHILAQRLVDDGAQPRVMPGIPAPGAGGDGNLADNFGENFTALGVLRPFVAADIGPFTVAGHNESSSYNYVKIVRRSVTSGASQP